MGMAHIPGVHNVIEDSESRKFRNANEWMISDKTFKKLCHLWGKPEVDFFTKRLSSNLTKYVSWKPDPGTVSIDAVSVSCNYCYSYCFLPFRLIWKVINKIGRECQLALPIIPLLPTQSWLSKILRQAIATTQVFNSRHLQLPTTKMHLLTPKLQLVAFILRNNTYKTKDYHKRQKTYSSPSGAIPQKVDLLQHTENESMFVFQGISIHFNQL